MGITKDEGLIGNEKIEETVAALQKAPSDETLAVALTAIRRRMKEKGQLVVGVEPSAGSGIQIKMMQSTDGRKWIPVFTSFDEEVKGGSQVMSTFLADIDQLLAMVLNEKELEGLILNPWSQRFPLNRELLKVIQG